MKRLFVIFFCMMGFFSEQAIASVTKTDSFAAASHLANKNTSSASAAGITLSDLRAEKVNAIVFSTLKDAESFSKNNKVPTFLIQTVGSGDFQIPLFHVIFSGKKHP